MTIRERLKRHSKSILIFLTATVLIVLLSLVLLGNEPESSALAESPLTVPTSPSSSSATLEQPAQSLVTKQQFDIEVIYAYVGKGLSETPHSHFDGVLMYPKNQYQSVIYFNVTHVSNSETESCDAIIEVYLIEVTSDTGCTEKYKYFEGTNYNPDFQDLTEITMRTYALIPMYSTSVERGFFTSNLTTNQSILGHRVGSIGSYTSGPSELGLWSAGEPNTITVSIYRVGWTVAKGSSVSLIRDECSEAIEEVQLEKFGDGFLYNTVVPQHQLSQMDLFHPDSLTK